MLQNLKILYTTLLFVILALCCCQARYILEKEHAIGDVGSVNLLNNLLSEIEYKYIF